MGGISEEAGVFLKFLTMSAFVKVHSNPNKPSWARAEWALSIVKRIESRLLYMLFRYKFRSTFM
jgi:hypothetical protein